MIMGGAADATNPNFYPPWRCLDQVGPIRKHLFRRQGIIPVQVGVKTQQLIFRHTEAGIPPGFAYTLECSIRMCH
jgi:hypothetical protein